MLEQKVLVFESLSLRPVSHELERGGLSREAMAIVSDYDLARYTVSSYPICAAVLYVPAQPENGLRTQELHKALRQPNPYVWIYHVVSFPLSPLEEMQRFGLINLAVTGLVPAQFGGSAQENPLCGLGGQLQRKYFSGVAQA